MQVRFTVLYQNFACLANLMIGPALEISGQTINGQATSCFFMALGIKMELGLEKKGSKDN